MPTLDRRTIIKEGALAGIIAGMAFAAGQILAAAFADLPPGAPWQFFSTVITGGETIEGSVRLGTLIVGGVIHLALSALFGAIFGLIVSAIARPVRNNLTLELVGGALYGLVLWVVNVQLIGHWLFPWFLSELNPAIQAMIHAVFFGLPMATWLALRIRDVETPGVHEARHRYQTSTGDEEYLRLQQWETTNRDTDHFTGTRQPPRGGGEGRHPGGPTLH